MNDMSIEECKEFLLEHRMNRFKVDEWYELLQSPTLDVVEYEKIVFYFACNVDNYDGYASKHTTPTFLSKIEESIYECLKDERLSGKFDVYTAVGLSSAIQSITNASSMDQKVINMFITLILTEIIKIGINAWCKLYEAKRKDVPKE